MSPREFDDDTPYEVHSQWPPPGNPPVVRVEFNLDGFPSFEYEFSMPGTTETTDIGTFIVGRNRGPNAADREFRQTLYFLIGAITVAQGHIEMAMKRLLIVFGGHDARLSLVDLNWSQLEQRLEAEANNESPDATWPELRSKLREHLTYAKRRHLKIHRDNIIHGYIWDYAMPVLLIARFERKSDGGTIVLSLDEIRHYAQGMHDYARRLDSILHGVWPEAMLDS